MELYHGSEMMIKKPVLGAGNPNNDYGSGFYCTEWLELAKEWACRNFEDGFANTYSIDTSGLTVLNLENNSWHVLNWLAVLLENRIFEIGSPLAKEAKKYLIEHFLPPYKNADIIIGYRADDSYFSFAKAFINGAISLESLSKAMRLGKLGIQYCIKSQKALDKLTFIEAILVDGTEYYVKRTSRDLKARDDYRRLTSEQTASREIYMIDILREKWRNDDERIR